MFATLVSSLDETHEIVPDRTSIKHGRKGQPALRIGTSRYALALAESKSPKLTIAGELSKSWVAPKAVRVFEMLLWLENGALSSGASKATALISPS